MLILVAKALWFAVKFMNLLRKTLIGRVVSTNLQFLCIYNLCLSGE